MAEDDPADRGESRRRFLQITTCAIGAGVGAAVIVPAARLFAHPVGVKTVSAADEPIDAIGVGELRDLPVRVPMIAREVRDGWAAQRDVALGAAWIRRDAAGRISVLSSVCPHKGCAIGFSPQAKQFECPCHGATFDLDGARQKGPSERGLDPLPFTVEGERVKVRWVRYQPGGSDRKPA